MTLSQTDVILDRLEALFLARGAEAYLGEPVTVAEHMLQCAALAESEGAPDALIAAALLHDVGHLTGAAGEYTPEDRHDRRHEIAGAQALEGFPPIVVESVRLHVEAKRYLCASEKSYVDRLTPASRHSLELQGGPMSSIEMGAFEALPHHQEAVRVRLWDDGGKLIGSPTQTFAHFRPLLRQLLASQPSPKRDAAVICDG